MRAGGAAPCAGEAAPAGKRRSVLRSAPPEPVVLDYAGPSRPKAGRSPPEPKQLHGSLALLANVILLVNSGLAACVLVTLLPASAAVLTLPVNSTLFLFCRTRLRMGGYLLAIHGIALLVSIIFSMLIETFGRQYFEVLLNWD